MSRVEKGTILKVRGIVYIVIGFVNNIQNIPYCIRIKQKNGRFNINKKKHFCFSKDFLISKEEINIDKRDLPILNDFISFVNNNHFEITAEERTYAWSNDYVSYSNIIVNTKANFKIFKDYSNKI